MVIAVPLVIAALSAEELALIMACAGTGYYGLLQMSKVPPVNPISSDFSGGGGGGGGGSFQRPPRNPLDKFMEELKKFVETMKGKVDLFKESSKNGNEIDRLGSFAPLPLSSSGFADGFNEAQQAANRPDPLIIDLDGDGIETTDIANGKYFDLDNNGFAENTAWVGKDDGILFIDKNNDGYINNGSELFGDQTLLSSGQKATSGFEALADLDTNQDGVIDQQDAAFSSLKIIKGSSTQTYTLAELGIKSLNLSYIDSNLTDINGNLQARLGNYTLTDGSTRTLGDYHLSRDTFSSIATTILDETSLGATPNLMGSGTVYTLRQAMLRDTSGTLQNLVASFSQTTDAGQRLQLIEQILYAWTGVSRDIDPNSRGDFDARKLAILEAFMGAPLNGSNTSFINPNSAAWLESAYQNLVEETHAQLASQTIYKNIFNQIFVIDQINSQVTYDLQPAINFIQDAITTDLSTGKELLGDFTRVLKGVHLDGSTVYGAYYQYFSSKGDDFKWILDSVGKIAVTGTDENDPDLNGSGTNDAIRALAGDDYAYGFQGNDFIDGGSGNDLLLGCEGDDIIEGGAGNDRLKGMLGMDMLLGGSDNDELDGNDEADILDGGDGHDTLLGGTGDDRLLGGIGDDFLLGGIGDDILEGQDGNDYSLGEEGDDFIQGALGNDSLHGGSGNDLIDGQDGNDLLTGDEGNDWLLGGNGQDDLYGHEGQDTLEGGAGNDILNGDLDSDTYRFEAGFGQDQLTDYSANAGTDVVSFGPSLLASNAVFTGDQFNNLVVSFQNSSDSLFISGQLDNTAIETFQFSDGTSYTANQIKAMLQTLGTTGDDYLNGSSYAETLSASSGNDYIYAGIGNDTVDGGAGNDELYGAEGDDSLNGGTGTDSMYGGLGNDTYIVDSTTDVVSEEVNEGSDTIQSSITYTLGTNVENLTLTGAAAINATGNTLNNILVGNSANNILSGNTGADSMYGGAGNDTYVVDHLNDLVSENVNEGTDTVQSRLTYTLTDNLENLVLSGSSAVNATGNSLNNSLTGNSASNVLTGGIGNDTLNGAVGTDTLVGGTGNDVYVVDTTTDTLTENLNEGTDTVQSSVTYTLGNNVENLTLTGTGLINGTGNTLNNSLIGNAANNSLSGGAGNDTLNGGAGNDSLIGGTGNDTYIVDTTTDTITENASEGTDTIQSSVTYTLGSNLENLSLTGTAAINATGNTLNNVLTGNSANNSLFGDAGNDTLDGTTGVDTLNGGIGNDVYIVDSTTDTITENLSEGTDTVQSSVTYTLGNNVENLTLTGTGVINGTGNGLNNSLIGNSANNSLSGGSGNDTLNGGVGADTLIGGLGNDTFVVDNTGDVVSEIANEGTDTVQSSISYTLGSNLENLTLTGTSALNGTGNTLNNILLGNTANNSLNGGSGADTLTGDKGNDTLIGGTGNDLYQFKLGDGLDVIQENDSTAGNLDKVKFDSSILKAKVAVFMLNGSLQIGYQGNTTDQITIQGQNTATGSVERLELSDGYFMTNADINQVIQNMTSYASNNGISLTSLNDVKNNQDLLNIVAAGWHT